MLTLKRLIAVAFLSLLSMMALAEGPEVNHRIKGNRHMGHQHRAGRCGAAAYVTTLFDYVRRAMPLNAQTLPGVHMPNRDGFIPFSQ